MLTRLRRFIYSFPVQLFAMHFRSDLILVGTWIFILLIILGKLGARYGLPYLFLAPEYLGHEGSLSFLLIGLGFGAFAVSWNLTVYLLSAYRFPFLATLHRPFAKFSINNFLLPTLFVLMYLYMHIRYGLRDGLSANAIALDCLSFILGFVGFVAVIAVYFANTNKDIFSFLKLQKIPPPDLRAEMPNVEAPEQSGKHGAFPRSWRVEVYLSESLKPRLVRPVSHYDPKLLQQIFKQNHLNMLVAQFISILVLGALGFWMDYPALRFPAAMAIFLLCSVFISVFGAVSYWFHRWRFPALILMLGILNALSRHGFLHHENQAYGLHYDCPPAVYDHAHLSRLCEPENALPDMQETEAILNRWLARRRAAGDERPRMVIFCASGGGLKASLMSLEALRYADSLFEGDFMPRVVLMAGASGGMLGTAWYRELYLQKLEGLADADVLTDRKQLYAAAENLINPIATSVVTTDLFLPRLPFRYAGHTYYKDRGYAFELQFNENTHGAFDKPLGAYREAEQQALIPLLFLSPSIVNDGRRLIISAQKVSYMMTAPTAVKVPEALDIDAVDFRRLLGGQDADRLRFSTALRMNATFPYILPNVSLPTEPQIEVMDAGFRDNYGLKTAIRFLHVFKDWIQEHTSGVVLIQVQVDDPERKIPSSANTGRIEGMFSPLGLATQITHLQRYEHDMGLGFLYELYSPEELSFLRFAYRPPNGDADKAPISFHLTQRNRRDIIASFQLPENQKSFKRLQELLDN